MLRLGELTDGVIELYRAIICAAFEFPVGLAFPNSSATTKAATHIDDYEMQRFSFTLRDKQSLLLLLFKTGWITAMEENPDEVTIDTISVDVDLPIKPNAKPTQIMMLAEQNFISRDYAKELMADITVIPRDKVCFLIIRSCNER